jgi:multiple sugar transport system substrate-binding protein
MRRLIVLVATFGMLAAACTAGGGGNVAPSAVNTASGASHTPVTLQLWSFYSGREFKQYDAVLSDFQKLYPWITINHTPGKSDQDILRAVNSGTSPDLGLTEGPDNIAKFCSSGAYVDLTPFLHADNMDITTIVPKPALQYTSYQGDQCSLPVLSDAYGLYYNLDMFQKAGVSEPPKTLSDLETDAKKLTVFNPDGSIKVAGFVPLDAFYESTSLFNGVYTASKWYDGTNKAAFATDPTWGQLLQYQQKFITDVYGTDGYSKLQSFISHLGGPNSEWSSAQGFETSQIAMALDGEWRTAFIKADKSKVNYATAPFPVVDAHPELYGAGQIGGDVIGIPNGAPHPAEAWLLLKYLATNTQAEEKLAETLGNVPTTFDSLKDPVLANDPHFKVFLQIFANANSAFKPLTTIGDTDETLWANFLDKWQAGQVSDLQSGLQQVSQQIDQQFTLG